MKRIIIPFLIVVMICCLGVSFQFLKVEKKDPILKKFSTISYFIPSYQKRYEAYRTLHPSMSLEEVVTKVNIGLDKEFYQSTKPTPYLNQTTILINKYYYVLENYVPDNLVLLDSSYSKSGIYLVKEAKEQLEKMITAAAQEGHVLRVISAYRSYSYQVKLYQNYVAQDGIAAADTYSARPGYSEHQSGLVVDIDNGKVPYTSFETTKEYTWMVDHAYQFGFILRYPKGTDAITGYQFEAWHYRYVGKELALKIKNTHLTFDEYYARYLDSEL